MRPADGGPAIGERIGKYEVIREVGRGSTGTVYLSHDPFYGRDVAIMRGKFSNALVLLGSATPTIESYANALEGKYTLVTLSRRVLDRPLARVAVVNMRVSPLPRGGGFEFVDKVVGGAIPKQYVAACRLGIEEAMVKGGTEGIPVVDVQVECLDGKTHSVDSSDMAFRTAASTGFFEAVQKAGPALLEPISLVTVEVPTELQGDVLGDLSSRRGRVVGSDVDSGVQTIRAEVPAVELSTYAVDMRALTGGRGRLTIEHSRYDVVPEHLAPKLLEGRAK